MDVRTRLEHALGAAYTIDRELAGGGMSHVYVAEERALGWKTELIVRGQLRGELIAAEHVVRDGVSIPLNSRDGMLVGSVHSTGDKFGGKNRMILTAARLTQRRETPASR